jgi:NitT/TauT family transport system substrate-binding protein
MTVTRRAFVSTAAAATGALAAPRFAFAQAAPATVTFGPALAVYSLSMVAIEKGFATAEGLDLKIVPTDAGARSRQVLAANEAMFAHGDASHPLQLTNRGKKAKILLATQMVASISNMVIRQDLYDQGITDVDKLADWKRPNGAKPVVAATAIGSGTWMFGTYVFETRKHGQKINWVAGGGSKTMLAGLQTKQFDAIMAPPAWQLECERQGFGRIIYDTRRPETVKADFGGTLPVLVIYTLEETIERDRQKTQAFVNTMYRAMSWIKATPIDEVYALIGQKYFGSMDPASTKVELAFDRETWAYDGRVSQEDFARGGRVWYRDGTDIPPTDYKAVVDMSFAEAARAKYG